MTIATSGIEFGSSKIHQPATKPMILLKKIGLQDVSRLFRQNQTVLSFNE